MTCVGSDEKLEIGSINYGYDYHNPNTNEHISDTITPYKIIKEITREEYIDYILEYRPDFPKIRLIEFLKTKPIAYFYEISVD